MIRSALSVFLALACGGVTIGLVEVVGHRIVVPFLVGSPDDTGGVSTAGYVLVLVAWASGSLLAGWLAARLAPQRPLAHAVAVGALLMTGGLFNLFAIPSPAWFWLAGLLSFLPFAITGAKLAGPRAA